MSLNCEQENTAFEWGERDKKEKKETEKLHIVVCTDQHILEIVGIINRITTAHTICCLLILKKKSPFSSLSIPLSNATFSAK